MDEKAINTAKAVKDLADKFKVSILALKQQQKEKETISNVVKNGNDLLFAVYKLLELFPKGEKPEIPLDNNVVIRRLALEVAATELGVKETTGNNDGNKIQEYQEHQSFLKNQPWCCSFISWCFKKAAAKMQLNRPFPHNASVFNFTVYASKQGWYNSDVKFKPEPGDLFVMADKHIGFVKSYNDKDRTIVTLEGNYNNSVGSRTEKAFGKITGYIRVEVNQEV